MRTRVRGWRWRQNPLRRHSDVVEAWTALLVAVLLVFGAPLAGVLTGWWAHDYAHTVAATQRARLHEVRAEVVGMDAATQPGVGTGDGSGYRATVRWTEPGSGRHTTTALVPPTVRQGSTVEVWLDARGRSVPAPPGATAVWQHAVTMGSCAAGGTAAVVLLGSAVVRRTATRHRMAEWERDWARTEPEWRQRRL
ncbi:MULTISPECIES: hypothetical protein [unclassified Streptomyces]|uniref:Rv1733c family protein n=1 Tax=unclassified Streptomyces TaxID=2593676 RepID=UPI003321A564